MPLHLPFVAMHKLRLKRRAARKHNRSAVSTRKRVTADVGGLEATSPTRVQCASCDWCAGYAISASLDSSSVACSCRAIALPIPNERRIAWSNRSLRTELESEWRQIDHGERSGGTFRLVWIVSCMNTIPFFFVHKIQRYRTCHHMILSMPLFAPSSIILIYTFFIEECLHRETILCL